MEPFVVEAGIGLRGNLGDATPRAQASVALQRGRFGAELDFGLRLGEGSGGTLASMRFQPNDDIFYVLRDDAQTLTLLATYAPFARVGPDLAVGPEVSWMQYEYYGYGSGVEGPLPTLGVTVRAGVHAFVGRAGLRLSLADRLNWLEEPTQAGGDGGAGLVDEWRVAGDFVVRFGAGHD